MNAAGRIVRIGLTSADPEKLATFYARALGFEIFEQMAAAENASVLFAAAGCGGRIISMRLGRQIVDLVGFSRMGQPYPDDIPGWSPLFQHIAIVVADIHAAHARLLEEPGWRAISLAGPERLPQTSGGVSAFKFRDPEGHPLEFLKFPSNAVPEVWRRPALGANSLGIDHTALSVSNTERSIRFYADMGLTVASRSRNVGVEQARLDAVPEPDVEVTALAFRGAAPPHLELLCYRGSFARAAQPASINDVAATRITIEMESAHALQRSCDLHEDALVAPLRLRSAGGSAEALTRDPDGHLLWLVAPDGA